MGFSKEQLKAIESKNTNELVNAGAGSGKTSVLSEHFLYLMKNCGYKPKDFLIVTFTSDAANEMKERIRKALINDEQLKDYAKELDACNIQTFDSFNNFIVKKYGRYLGIENISIMDETFENILLKNIIDEIFAKHYEDMDTSFIETCLGLSIKNDEDIRKFVINILRVASLKENPDKFIDEYVDKHINSEFIDDLFNKFYTKIKQDISFSYELADSISYQKDHDAIINVLSKVNDTSDFDTFIKIIKDLKFPSKGKNTSSLYTDLDLSNRDRCKKIFANYKELASTLKTEKIIKSTYLAQLKFAKVILSLTKEVKYVLDTFKKENGLYRFEDIAKLAIELMEIEEVCLDVKKNFKYIMIDEYQDTSDIQEKMISLLENNNVFMVGDVKQSIYRFRHANCQIFEDKYQSFKKEIGGHKIDMTQNFRSRKEFMEDLNKMFTLLMNKTNNPISYFPDHMSNYGNIAYDDNKDENLSYGISSIRYDKTFFENMKTPEIEASLIANDIIRKYNAKVKVYDKELKAMRQVSFKDFAIICDRGSKFDIFKRVFTKYKIPLYIQKDTTIENSDVAMVVKNLFIVLLKIKNKQYDDIFLHSYCSIIRSFVFRYDDKRIYNIIKNKQYESDDAFIILKDISACVDELNLKEIMDLLINKLDIENSLITLGDINENQYILDYLRSLADTFDGLYKDIDEFVAFFDDVYKEKINIKASSIQDIDDSVLLTNIHKSKGREFPLVYYANLASNFNSAGLKSDYVIDDTYGLTLGGLYNDENISISKYLYKQNEIKEDREEKLRLLYVALTRAKECAILVMPKYTDKKDLYECNNMLQILSIAPIEENKIIYINYLEDTCVPSYKEEEKIFVIKENKEIISEEISVTHASKKADDNVNEELIKKGEKLHYLLELVDFSTKNVDFIKDDNDKKLIQKVIHNNVFNISGLKQIIHEYAYEDDGVSGVIDCLVIGEDEIRIIDFKLKNIDDSNYDKQLRTYKRYISKIANNKLIKMYLLSIVNNELREVKDE